MDDDSYCEFVLDQLRRLGTVDCRPMPDGHELHREEKLFGVVSGGALYFRTDAQTRDRYTASGMKPLATHPKQALSDFYQVPVDVVEDVDQLLEWGAEAIRCGETDAAE
ncbi:MAG: TfoX/Sxy family protein [Planctomycetia bacterium]|nr:TfoX/Sxy family protein [Planctomycetia bacterium]